MGLFSRKKPVVKSGVYMPANPRKQLTKIDSTEIWLKKGDSIKYTLKEHVGGEVLQEQTYIQEEPGTCLVRSSMYLYDDNTFDVVMQMDKMKKL